MVPHLSALTGSGGQPRRNAGRAGYAGPLRVASPAATVHSATATSLAHQAIALATATLVAAALDRVTAAGKGQVVGIAATSAGRNVPPEAGIPVAREHGSVPRPPARPPGSRGATSLGPDALVILDEAFTTSMPDLAAIVRPAARSGAKVVITGGHAQLGAALMARDAIDVRGNLQITG